MSYGWEPQNFSYKKISIEAINGGTKQTGHFLALDTRQVRTGFTIDVNCFENILNNQLKVFVCIQPRWLSSLMRLYHSVYGLFPCERWIESLSGLHQSLRSRKAFSQFPL